MESTTLEHLTFKMEKLNPNFEDHNSDNLDLDCDQIIQDEENSEINLDQNHDNSEDNMKEKIIIITITQSER